MFFNFHSEAEESINKKRRICAKSVDYQKNIASELQNIQERLYHYESDGKNYLRDFTFISL